MAEYNYPDDGKLHTRLSELSQCSALGAREVAMRRLGLKPGFASRPMIFGQERHKFHAEESEKTRRLPKCFTDRFPELAEIELDLVEQEMASEIFPNLVLHSTADGISLGQKIIVDHKNLFVKKEEESNLEAIFADRRRKYAKSKQGFVYAYQVLILYKIKIEEVIFTFEAWDEDMKKILGYGKPLVLPVTYNDIMGARQALKQPASFLKVAMDSVRKT